MARRGPTRPAARSEPEIREWAEALRAQRISATGRMWCDVIEDIALRMLTAESDAAYVKLARELSTAQRDALTADGAERDRMIAELHASMNAGAEIRQRFLSVVK